MGQPALPGVGSPITPLRPGQPPAVTPGLPPFVPSTPSPTPSVAHAIRDAAIDGASAYPPGTWNDLIHGLTGPSVPQEKIEAARTAIVNRYRHDGYVYTAVNAAISGDRLRFVVIEGHITDVKLDGDIGPAGTQVLRFLNHLTDLRPVSVAGLERWLLLAGDVPGVSVHSVLNPTDVPGEITLIAQVSRKAVSGLLTADNRAFNLTGPEEGLAVVDFNSFTEFGEKTEVSLYHTFNDTQSFGQASTEVFIGGSGLRGKIYGGAGGATPSGYLGAIGYDGITNVFGGDLTYPVIREREQTLNVGVYFDAIDATIKTLPAGRNGSRGKQTSDSLRVFSAGFDYTILDTLVGGDFGAVNTVAMRGWQGLPILGASSNARPAAARAGQRIDFTKWTAQISRNQTLFQPWQNASVALQPTLSGQYSANILPPEEEYYLGGPHFNRGYYYGQITGDKAAVASAELQLNTGIPLPEDLGVDVSAQFYAFYDWGEAWQNQVGGLNTTLRSTGLGVRTYITEFLEIDLEGVRRFNLRPNVSSAVTTSELPSTAFYWQFLAKF